MRKWCSCKSCLKLLILWARSVWCWSLTLYDVSDIHCVQHTSACRAYMRCVDWWAASAAAVTHSSRGRVVRAEEQAKLPLSGHGERGDQWARRYSSQYATWLLQAQVALWHHIQRNGEPGTDGEAGFCYAVDVLVHVQFIVYSTSSILPRSLTVEAGEMLSLLTVTERSCC